MTVLEKKVYWNRFVVLDGNENYHENMYGYIVLDPTEILGQSRTEKKD
ncbi:uncharacterized protein METZ01_LOCUS418862 [marine metagenome]|uniref:Uncharacterized protein n=1 Tax=marine metagenome TaxID=408172 RepID=A0A382X6N0_9ZZZZ